MKIVIIIFFFVFSMNLQSLSQNMKSVANDRPPMVSGSQGIQVGSLSSRCSKTPYWNLNKCDISCAECQKGQTQCSSCLSNFTLKNGQCSTTAEYGYYQKHLTANILEIWQISQFSFSDSSLSQENVVTFCSPNIYQFQMLGLFQQDDRIYYSTSFAQEVTDVRIKLLFFSIFPNVNILINVNNQNMFSYTFSQLVNLNVSYQNQTNFIQVLALTSQSANNLIQVIDTGFYSIPSSSAYMFEIQVIYLDDQTSTQIFWAISDFSVTAKRCQTCLSNNIKKLGSNFGIALGITSGTLVVLILILYLSNLYQRRQRFLEKNSDKKNQLFLRQAAQQLKRIFKSGIGNKNHNSKLNIKNVKNSKAYEELKQKINNGERSFKRNQIRRTQKESFYKEQ